MMFQKQASIFHIIVLLLPFLGHTEGSIVVMHGTCSAGKTTLGKEILRQDPSWVLIDEDDILIEYWLEEIERLFPSEFATVSRAISQRNRFQAIKNNCIFFDDTASEQEQHDALNAIEKIRSSFNKKSMALFKLQFYKKFKTLTVNAIKEGLQENKNILLDRWYIKTTELETLFPSAVLVKALVFCPLESSIEKLKKRNEEAFQQNDAYNYRIYRQLLVSYNWLYRVTDSPEKTLYSTSIADLDALFNLVSESIEAEGTSIVPQELSQKELSELKEMFIPSSFDSDKAVYIAPKDDYDFIIDTEKLKPEEAAEEFLKQVRT